MSEYHVAWWNLENLFDVMDANEHGRRPEWLQENLRGGYSDELEGWDEEVLDEKCDQLASVIQRMNQSAGPDIMGGCEVENEFVLDRLLGAVNVPDRDYDTVYHSSEDARGIDVAFIYDRDEFEPNETFDRVIRKRSATRDLVQVNFQSKDNGERLILIGNHWPSRSGGQWQSEPYRMMAGETLSYWMKRIPEILDDDDVSVLVMGDFNDEPHNRSLTEYALAARNEKKIDYSHESTPYLYNLSWSALGNEATYYYDGTPLVIDQFLASKGMVNGQGDFSVLPDTASVVRFDDMVEDRGYPAPIRFGRPSYDDGFHPDTGYSDHLPITVRVRSEL
jgi:predicted extracellular nuclease